MKVIKIFILITMSNIMFGQNVGIGTETPDTNAVLHVHSETKGLLIPTLTTAARVDIIDPPAGMILYDSTQQTFYIAHNSGWTEIRDKSKLIKMLSDNDLDTKIEVESTMDSDSIIMSVAGHELIVLDGNTMHLNSLGKSVFIGKDAGINDDNDNNRNVFVGYESGEINNSGSSHVFIGYQSGNSQQSGVSNTYIGHQSGLNNTTGSNNTFVGSGAGVGSNSFKNTSLGAYSLESNNNGNSNVAIGLNAGGDSDGSRNVFLGHHAGKDAIGNDQLYIDNSATDRPLIYGDFNSNLVRIHGELAVDTLYHFPLSRGQDFEVLTSFGNGITAWSAIEDYQIIDDDNDTYITTYDGINEDEIQMVINNEESHRFKLNANNDALLLLSEASTFIGLDVGDNNTGVYNTMIGGEAGRDNTSGSNNAVFGRQAGRQNTTGSNNTFIGSGAGVNNRNHWGNVYVGSVSAPNNEGEYNTILGTQAGKDMEFGSFNTLLGYKAGGESLLGQRNVIIGNEAGKNLVGDDKLYIANSDTDRPLIYGDFNSNLIRIHGELAVDTLYNFPLTRGEDFSVLTHFGNGNTGWLKPENNQVIDADYDTYVTVDQGADEDKATFYLEGIESYSFKLDDKGNPRIDVKNNRKSIFIGESAGDNNTGDDNTIIGYFAGSNSIGSGNNTFIGKEAGKDNTSGGSNTFLGANAGKGNGLASNNTYVGLSAGTFSTGGDNTMLGSLAGRNNTTGEQNVFIGRSAGDQSGDADGCIFIGFEAGLNEDRGETLVIDNSSTAEPLIYGEFDNNRLLINGQATDGNRAAFEVRTLTDGNRILMDGKHIDAAGSDLILNKNVASDVRIGEGGGSVQIGAVPDLAAKLTVSTVGIERPITATIDNTTLFTVEHNGGVSIGNHNMLPPTNGLKVSGDVQLGDVVADGYRLSVDGGIACENILLDDSGTWPDYVFEADYTLMPLTEVKSFINKHGHLPKVPSAKEVENKGFEAVAMFESLLEKIEELTLHTIKQQEEIEALKAKLK